MLDIDASVNGTEPDYWMIANSAAECRMPLCYGGGVHTPEQAKKIIGLGVEKVAMSAAMVDGVCLVTGTADTVGRQSVVVVLDTRKKTALFAKGYEVFPHNGGKSITTVSIELAQTMKRPERPRLLSIR